MRALARRLLTAALFVLLAVPAWAQTGKISGRVTDAQTGDALPGVNVIIEGTTQGAGTDLDGYYTILNVRPGTYTLDASFIGYAPQRIEGVRVSVDQTATVNIQLREEAFEGEEIVVTAERPVVQPDVSNSQLVISGEKVEALPVAEVTSAIGLQAGVQVGTNGPVVRGGDPRDLLFNVNGLTLRDQRTNNPFINVPLSAVGDISVQTGGFNAEYGNARSGVVNVTTKLGSRDRYEATVTTRYSPPQQKHFGDRADNPDTYWLRPYLDPDVAFTGTRNGAWDEYTQAQFPEFAGWNALSAERLRNDDPTDDLSPFALQQAFLFQHRKQMEITDPDYTIDAGVGGPLLPGGRARFYASFRQDQEMYLVPLSEDAFRSSVGHMKVTTELTTGMRLSVEGLLGNTTGTTSRRDGGAGIFRSPASIASQLDRVSFIDTRIYASDYWNPTEIESNMVGATFTHTLDQNTFYEAKITRFGTDYNTFLNPLRDSTAVVTIGGVGFDEAPFGFQPRPTFGVEGMRTGVGMSNARDTSNVIDWNFKLDVTRQFNRFLQGKAGVEYTVTDFDVSYGRFDEFLPSSNAFTAYDVTRQSLGGYAQTKLEFQGLIANLGLRLEYFRSRDDFFVFEPFTQAFSAQFAAGLDTLLTRESVDGELTLSPRLGVSFPITTSSKLYFNYGHFRNLLQPDNLYPFEIFSSTGQINFVPNPGLPLPKTVSYELGYEQALFSQYALKAAGYYRDVSLQPRGVSFFSRDGGTSYTTIEPNSYEDIRGFELTLSKLRGRWIQGFVNYTYMVFSEGFFGLRQVNENRTAQRLFEQDDAERRAALSKPVPQPYARVNVDFLTPADFGPKVGGIDPLANWVVSLIGRWQSGFFFTWTGGGDIPNIRNNVQFRDGYGLDLRFSKGFDVAGVELQFFGDVFNLLNRKVMSPFYGAVDGNDYTAYMRSLHLPAPETPGEYGNIVGTDRPGDFRAEGVEFQPIEQIQTRDEFNEGARTPNTRAIYFERSTDSYIVFGDGTWQPVEQGRLDQVLEDKAYIDMPNQSFLNFLNPRQAYFGIRVNF